VLVLVDNNRGRCDFDLHERNCARFVIKPELDRNGNLSLRCGVIKSGVILRAINISVEQNGAHRVRDRCSH